MLGNLNNAQIDEVLTQQIIGRIGCHANDVTYIVPISYAYEDGCVYGRTYAGLKIQIMTLNPKVCFQVDIMEDMANWKSVIAWGEFRELTETSERNAGIQKLMARKITGIPSKAVKLSPLWPFSSNETENLVDGIIFSIRLGEKTGRFENSDQQAFENIG